MNRTFRTASSAAVVALATAIGCSDPGSPDDDVEIPPPTNSVCSSAKAFHEGQIGTDIWRAEDGPHYITSDVFAQTLTIEAGTVICTSPSAHLIISTGGTLDVNGTATQPIRFASADSSRRWGGIRIQQQSTLRMRNAVFEHADTAIFGDICASITVDSIHIRQSGNGVVAVQSCPIVIRKSVFDTISADAIRSRPRPTSVCTACTPPSDLRVVVEDNIIRAADRGIYLDGWAGEITVNGGRIEDTGQAFTLEASAIRVVADAVVVHSTRPLRIAGSDRPVRASVIAFAEIWPIEHRDSLRGNTTDTVYVEGAYRGELRVTKAVPIVHILKPSPILPWTEGIERVTVDAGATFGYRDHATIGTLVVNGTPTEPATIALNTFFVGCATGVGPNCTPTSDTSYVRHARIISGGSGGAFSRPVVLDSVHVRGSDIGFSAGSILTNTTFDRAAPIISGGARLDRVRVSGRGISIAGDDVAITNCEIVDVPGTGVHVLRGTHIRINDCNIERNSGPPIYNGTSSTIDARRNWWGSPMGPPGSNGVEIQGDVDYSEFRRAPISSDPPAASISVAPAFATVATGDTVRFVPTARDGSGNVLPNERFMCRVETNIGECDFRLGIVAGLLPGATTVEFIALSDTTIRGRVQLDVVLGGVSFRWTRISQFVTRWRFPFSVFGTSPSNVIVGGNQLMVRFDGTSWTPVDQVNGMIWNQVIADQSGRFYGVASTDAYASNVLEFDGATWRPLLTTTNNVCRVSVGRDSTIAVATHSGTIHVKRGAAWDSLGPGIQTCDAWVRSSNNIFAPDDSIVAHWNGVSWTRYRAATQFHSNSGNSIGPKPNWDSGQFVYSFGYNNAAVVRLENGSWQPLADACGGRAVLGSSDTNLFTAGGNGTLCHFDGTRWRNVWTGTQETLADLWFQGDEIFLVTVTGLIYHGRRP